MPRVVDKILNWCGLRRATLEEKLRAAVEANVTMINVDGVKWLRGYQAPECGGIEGVHKSITIDGFEWPKKWPTVLRHPFLVIANPIDEGWFAGVRPVVIDRNIENPDDTAVLLTSAVVAFAEMYARSLRQPREEMIEYFADRMSDLIRAEAGMAKKEIGNTATGSPWIATQ